jgi:putative FmdB family regulatory protein
VPIYEYQCDTCSYKFEVKQSIKDDPIVACERCGKPVRRLISSSGIMFKGSGWYVTDYSNKMKPPSEGEKKTEGEKSTTTGGEKKEAPAGSTASTASSPANPSSASTSSPASSSTPTPSTSTTNPSSKNS